MSESFLKISFVDSDDPSATADDPSAITDAPFATAIKKYLGSCNHTSDCLGSKLAEREDLSMRVSFYVLQEYF